MNSDLEIPFWGRISFLWLMLTPVVCAIYTLLLPIAPNDFWYNARAGAVIVETGQIPTTALFTTSLPQGTPYYYQSWIAQVLLFKTLQIGSLSGIVLLRTFCLTFAFTLLVCAAMRRAQSLNNVASSLPATTCARVVALSTILAFVLAASNMDVRPQTFSVLLFALWTFLIFEWSRASDALRLKIIAAFFLLMILWANTHGAFFTGLIVLVAFFSGEWLHFLLARKNTKFGLSLNSIFGVAPTLASLRLLGIGVAMCALAALFNPRGALIYSYVWKLAGLKAGQKFIQEWQSPGLHQWYGVLFFASILGVSLLAICLLKGVLPLRARSVSQGACEPPKGVLGAGLGEMTVLSAMAVLALRDIRSIIWFALLLSPILTAMCVQLFLSRPRPAALETSPPKSVQVANATIAILLIFSSVPLLPSFKPQLGMPPQYALHFAPNPPGEFPVGFSSSPLLLLERETPVEVVEAMKKNPPRGRLWNDMVFGSYLTWVGAPLLPHCDPRVEMYPLAFWEEYGRLLDGPTDAARVLQRQGFSDALLHKEDQKSLIAVLRKNRWRVMAQQGQAVWLRARE